MDELQSLSQAILETARLSETQREHSIKVLKEYLNQITPKDINYKVLTEPDEIMFLNQGIDNSTSNNS